jgi:S-methylmethionine-dependent homocysteine/selenocysteine methylase
MYDDGRRDVMIVLDGATGTELQRRGFATNAVWTADAAVHAPDLLRQVHLDYLAAGADVVTANTFRTQPWALRAAQRDSEAAELTRRSVALARAACTTAGHGRVAGSMAPLEDCYRPERVPPPEVLRREHALHARHLAAAGVDLVLVETMNTAREAHAAAEAALVAGLRVWVSLILDARTGDVLSGEDLEVAMAHLRALEVEGRRIDGFALNCTPPAVMLDALQRIARDRDPRPLGAYANASRTDASGAWMTDPEATVERFGEWARACRDAGATLIGGCCGTTPAHIRAVRSALG